jgi:hypothetical protein
MAGVLTEESTVECGHTPGKVTTSGEARLTVNGRPVLTRQGVEGKKVEACGTVPATNPNSTPKDVKCQKVESVEKTEATRLRVDGKAVLIDPLGGTTDGMVNSVTPTTALGATVVQTRLKAE